MAGVRIAVIGAGHFGRFHAQKVAASPDAVLVGVHDRHAERAASVAAEVGAPVLGSAEAAIAAAEAVIVATPTAAHHPIAAAALEAGRHVLVEKPVTVTLAEADDLIARSASAGRVLQVGHLERFSAARGAIARHISRPLAMECVRVAPYRERGTDVSVVLDLMIHDIDLVLMLAAAAPVSVEATGAAVLSDTADVALARLGFADGRAANLSASRIAPATTRAVRLAGADGTLEADLVARTLRRFATSDRSVAEESWTDADSLSAQLAGFIAAIRGEAAVMVGGAAGRAALAVALEIEKRIGEATAKARGAELL
ncbi:Gfo/Idh/MocA family protein [Elioraea rosea]|uniref:Gfo/Idh/MocA family protein n=1 Tax=Elioraea rosea TaxID=2492390 RepID=UPI00118302F6|nr:Gfo/Idh/MocA family oxidoreductase [Elioraea rosea]